MDHLPESLSHLPVFEVLPLLQKALAAGSAVLTAPTGSGKTTAVPLALLDEPWLAGKKILILEPRRLATRAAAHRMSYLLGEAVGLSVGYRVRMDHRVSQDTRIEVVTEGILTRKIQSDPELADTGLIIFDEFHERNLQADLGLALCLDLMALRDDLRLLIMSATLDTAPLAALLGDVPVIGGHGKSYPVSLHYLPPATPTTPVVDNALRGIVHAYHQEEGDILCFLPGRGEIHRVLQRLQDNQDVVATILPLYGDLSHREQDRVLQPPVPGQRRIILATPIAETSLTLDGITCVVDTGFVRRPHYNPATGLSSLKTVRISRSSAEQRRGRAGRTAPGCCYRLWDSYTDDCLLPQTPPEILTADLCQLVLELALWGVTRPDELRWLDPPNPGHWQAAVDFLQTIGGLTPRGQITDRGRELAALPLHPRLATMLLCARPRGLGRTACLLAALLSERDILKGKNRSCDLQERLETLSHIQDNTKSRIGAAYDRKLCRKICTLAKKWQKLLHISTKEPLVPEQCGNLVAFGYPDRLAVKKAGNQGLYQLANGRAALLPQGDLLQGLPLLVIPHLDGGSATGRIHQAAPLSPEDLHRNHPHLLQTRENIVWDNQQQKVTATLDTSIGKALLTRQPLQRIDQEIRHQVFLKGVGQQEAHIFPWSKESRQTQARIESMRFWHDGGWPDVASTTLMRDLAWLAPYVSSMSRLSQLKNLNMNTILLSMLTWQQQQQLSAQAPTHLQVASGSRLPLNYTPGEPPVLAVRIQELYGQSTSPTILHGRVTVILHLLSPARRPVQITTDLASFWRTSYPEVKKELAGRYPKHYWPDDPLHAQATATTKKRMLAEKSNR